MKAVPLRAAAINFSSRLGYVTLGATVSASYNRLRPFLAGETVLDESECPASLEGMPSIPLPGPP
jgi:hypothetical protein